MPVYRDQLNSIYDSLSDEVSNYQFENIDFQPIVELKAIDLERADIPNLKILLINYFKYTLSRSNFYSLNQNLITAPTPEQIEQMSQQSSSEFLNLSNY